MKFTVIPGSFPTGKSIEPVKIVLQRVNPLVPDMLYKLEPTALVVGLQKVKTAQTYETPPFYDLE